MGKVLAELHFFLEFLGRIHFLVFILFKKKFSFKDMFIEFYRERMGGGERETETERERQTDIDVREKH